MIYVPDLENYKCFVVKNKDTIRAYEEIPQLNENVNYRDYYVNSNYLYSNGTELIENVPVCLSNDILTNESYYRNDFDSILIIFSILSIVCFIIPTLIIFKLFKRKSL